MSTPLQALRKQMKKQHVDAVLIPSTDFHGSEYVGAYFSTRAYISGFTGSAGTLLVLADWAGLWTDGRYFLQAEEQLKDSGITLMRQGKLGVPTVQAELQNRLQSGQCFAFDGRCLDAKQGKVLKKRLSTLGITVKTHLDLVGEVWSDRPALSTKKVWTLPLEYAGESREGKLERVRIAMKKHNADEFLLTSLEEIAWLLNLRGGDIACTPVFLSYLALSESSAILFANREIFSSEIIEVLEHAGVTLRPYDDVYAYAEQIVSGSRVLIDGRKANFRLTQSLSNEVNVIDRPSPIEGFKAVKNETEQNHMKTAHLKDGIALTKLMYWLKHQEDLSTVTELDVAERLEAFRHEQEQYLGPSFSSIVAYGPHGAIVHYSATESSNVSLAPSSFLLVDVGGHYLDGTTDCTRTFALGSLTDEQKLHYTAVLRGNLNLADAQFLHGCTGPNLDYLARCPLWSLKLDYNHGTGHGVGYLLNVHEGPNRFHWRSTVADAVLEAGMITSDEPGLYLEGEYGIRLENLILCVERGESAYGRFLGFEPLTLVPFERDAINLTHMSPREIELLNNYHKLVFDRLSPHLTDEECTWLKQATQAI